MQGKVSRELFGRLLKERRHELALKPRGKPKNPNQLFDALSNAGEAFVQFDRLARWSMSCQLVRPGSGALVPQKRWAAHMVDPATAGCGGVYNSMRCRPPCGGGIASPRSKPESHGAPLTPRPPSGLRSARPSPQREGHLIGAVELPFVDTRSPISPRPGGARSVAQLGSESARQANGASARRMAAGLAGDRAAQTGTQGGIERREGGAAAAGVVAPVERATASSRAEDHARSDDAPRPRSSPRMQPVTQPVPIPLGPPTPSRRHGTTVAAGTTIVVVASRPATHLHGGLRHRPRSAPLKGGLPKARGLEPPLGF